MNLSQEIIKTMKPQKYIDLNKFNWQNSYIT